MFYNLENINIEELNISSDSSSYYSAREEDKNKLIDNYSSARKLLRKVLTADEVTIRTKDFIKMFYVLSSQIRNNNIQKIELVFENDDFFKLLEVFYQQKSLKHLKKQQRADALAAESAENSIKNIDQMLSEIECLRKEIENLTKKRRRVSFKL